MATGAVDQHWAAAWADLLSGSTASIADALSRDDPAMTQLRPSTPFAGALTNAERWQILRTVA